MPTYAHKLGQLLNGLFWEVAKSYIVEGYKQTLAKIKEVNDRTFQWITNGNLEMWCRYMFSHTVKYDHVINNM